MSMSMSIMSHEASPLRCVYSVVTSKLVRLQQLSSSGFKVLALLPVAVILKNLDVIDKSVHNQRFPEEQTRRQVNEPR